MLYGDYYLTEIENKASFLPFHMVYAHGELENKLNYDIIQTDSIDLHTQIFGLTYDRKTLKDHFKLYDESVVPVTIIVWRDETLRRDVHGYVVLTSDLDSIRFAEEQQAIRPSHI